MKKSIVLSCFIGCTVMLLAQKNKPVTAAMAYFQPVQQGAANSTVAAENGKEKTVSPSSRGNWFIFLAYKNSQYIVPYRVWIAGTPFRVENEKIRTTPFVINRPGPGFSSINDTLVKKTSDKIIQVRPVTTISKLILSPAFAVEEYAVTGMIVVEYYWKAKRFSCILPEIKNLEPVTLQ